MTSAHEIIPGLWLGNMESSQDASFIKKNKIKAILNMTHDLPNKFQSSKHIEYGNVKVDDSLEEKDFKIMEHSLPYAVAFIHKNLDLEGKNIAVHCYLGAQRSAVATAAYLLKHHPEIAPTMAKAVKYVHSKRPIAWHNGESVNFDQALKAYKKTLSQPQVKQPSVSKPKTKRVSSGSK